MLKAPKLVTTWKAPVRKALKQLQVEVDNPARKKDTKQAGKQIEKNKGYEGIEGGGHVGALSLREGIM